MENKEVKITELGHLACEIFEFEKIMMPIGITIMLLQIAILIIMLIKL